MAKDFGPENTDAIRKAVIILGDSGVGKSLLAATSEDPYFLDVEGRAEHAHVHRFVPEQEGAGWDELVARVTELSKAPRLEGGFGINFKGVPIKTLVVDTIDRAQELLRMKNSNLTVNQKDKQRFYGVLLDRMLGDFVWPILKLPVNIIFISHTQEKSLDAIETREVNEKSAQIVPETGLALEGQVRNKLRNYFDSAFHMVRKQDGSTIILTNSQVYEGRHLYAKDKRWLFGGKSIPVKWVDGKIESDAFKKVFSEMHSASERKALVNQVKLAMRDHAVAQGIMKSPDDKDGSKVIAEKVIPDLQEQLDKITEAEVENLIDQGKVLIDNLIAKK